MILCLTHLRCYMDEDVAVKLIVNDLRQRFRDTIYDPVAGIGCIDRKSVV